jgi:hypothetical protein
MIAKPCQHCSQIGRHDPSCIFAQARARELRDELRELGVDPPPIMDFIAFGQTILMRGRTVGRMESKTLAKRAANALNRHQPNREGV